MSEQVIVTGCGIGTIFTSLRSIIYVVCTNNLKLRLISCILSVSMDERILTKKTSVHFC